MQKPEKADWDEKVAEDEEERELRKVRTVREEMVDGREVPLPQRRSADHLCTVGGLRFLSFFFLLFSSPPNSTILLKIIPFFYRFMKLLYYIVAFIKNSI